jgi:broad specificity phosphatase PhoE
VTSERPRNQKWPSHLLIVRHGQSERNVAREHAKKSGTSASFGLGLRDMDTSLTPRGFQEATDLGKRLAGKFKFDVVFSSPYLRAIQTSERVMAEMKNKPRLVSEERIREIEFGITDGLPAAGIKEKYPEEHARRKREGKYWYRPPGGESRPDVALRVQSFLGTLARDYREKSVLVVCHSVVVLIFRRLLERWGELEYMKVDQEQDVLNCSVTAYRCDPVSGKLVLDCYNDVTPFSADPGPVSQLNSNK